MKKKPTTASKLVALEKLSKTPEWKILCEMGQNRVLYQKDKIVALSESNPVKLAVNKAYERGIMVGVILMMRDVNNASNELNKLEEKEK